MTLFIILLWVAATVPFLFKNKSIRELTETICKQNVFTKAVAVSLLIVAIIHGSTKPTNAPSASPSVAQQFFAQSTTNSVQQTTSQTFTIPEWYLATGLPTTASDGRIPDEWKFLTITEDYDADEDPDDDVLENLAEFIAGTDPLTADTDGDGFGDGKEVADATNPLVHEDFNVTELDTNANGIPDYLDGLNLYNFTPDVDGFDEAYANYNLPPASKNTFDVLVHIESTRSVVLTWTGFDGGIVLPVAQSGAGQIMATRAVRLRLPFDADTDVKLNLHHGDASGIPSGPWKARMRVGFVASQGMSVSGDYASNGEVAIKRVTVCESTVEFVGGDGGGMSRVAGAGASSTPTTRFEAQDYSIEQSSDAWHSTSDRSSFTAKVEAGGLPDTVEWRVFYKGREGLAGSNNNAVNIRASSATALSSGSYDDITVEAKFIYNGDEKVHITRRATWKYCEHTTYTPVDIPEYTHEPLEYEIDAGCEHEEEYLEIEVMRHTSSGEWQHVAWFDMNAEEDGLQQTIRLPTTASATWDGKVRETVPQAEGKKVLNDFKKPLRRYLHGLSSGDYVTPGAYRIVARTKRVISDDGYGNPVYNPWEMHSKLVVPQIVQITWGSDALDALRTPVVYNSFGGTNIVLSPGINKTDEELKAETIRKVKSFFPPGANFKVVGDDVVVNGPYKKVQIWTPVEYGKYGESPIRNRNQTIQTDVDCWIGTFTADMKREYGDYDFDKNIQGNLNAVAPFLIPITFDAFHTLICKTIVHELAHSVGLVDNEYIDAFTASAEKHERYHHNPPTGNKIMNQGDGIIKMVAFLGSAGWHDKCVTYMELIIPSYSYDEEEYQ